MINLKRDSRGIALLDTIQERCKFTIDIILLILLTTIAFFSFIWLPYWIFTGENIFNLINRG